MKKFSKEEIIKKKEKANSFIGEFKQFISRGNVFDLAVGVIIGSALTSIVNSIVNDILMPIIGVLIGGHNFSALSIRVGTANITYGNFIQNVINFLIIALCLFIIIKSINKFIKKGEKTKEETPAKKDEVILLEEIRDLLRKKK